MKRTGTQNIQLKDLIVRLDKIKKPLWQRVSRELKNPSRNRRSVNIYKINKCIREGETALVPGTVLSVGELSKKITVAAWKFSRAAEEKINKKGRTVSISDLVKSNPDGKKVRIIG